MTITAPQSEALTVTRVEEIVQLEVAISKNGLEEATAQSLLESFRPIFAEVHALVEQAKAAPRVTDATQLTEMGQVRAIRLALARERVKGDKLREKLKADSLRRGNAIQGVYNLLKFMVEPLEESLLESEKFAERAEAARKEGLRVARQTALAAFGVDVTGWPLGDMPAAQFEKLLEDTRLAHEARLAVAAKLEADRIAKQKADAEEREKQRQENDRLKKEAQEKEAALKAERERVAKEQAEAAEVARQERLRLQALADVERQKAETEKAEILRKAAVERAEAEAKAKAEREAVEAKARAEKAAADAQAAKDKAARQKAEAEAKALRDAEAEKVAAASKAAKKLAAAPDKEKLTAFAQSLRGLAMPALATEEGIEILKEVSDQVDHLAEFVEKVAARL